MTLFRWSRVAANNATVDVTAPFPEGMSASALNDSARGQMAAVSKYRDDLSGQIGTTGTATAYALTSFQGFDTLANLDTKTICFRPHTTNGSNPTLNVDGLGPRALTFNGVDNVLPGVLVAGTPYVALFFNSLSVFVLQNNYLSPYIIPIGSGFDWWGPTVPSSGFAFPVGQAISRSQFSTLFSIIGTTYGVGDGSSTFNLPDKTGRISAMKEASATRLTSTHFGGNSTALGAVGGLESQTLITAQLPASPLAVTVSGTVSVASSTTFFKTDIAPTAISANAGAIGFNAPLAGATTGATTVSSSGANSLNGATANMGSGNPHNIVQPTIICNYIMRII